MQGSSDGRPGGLAPGNPGPGGPDEASAEDRLPTRDDPPPNQDDLPPTRDDRLDAIIARYLEDVAAGRSPDRRELVARNPDLARELEEFLRDHDAFRGAVRSDGPGLGGLAPERPVLAPGERLGDYEVVEEIARGGMGIVYRARQMSLGREVALKIIHPRRLDSEEDARRFLVEAETAARLDHPGIVPIHEVGEAGGRRFIAMKLLGGGDLRGRADLLAKEPRAAAVLLERVARAVAFAHEKGVLHRDLKPANIIFDRDGKPYVSDFGLAKRLDDDPGLTRTGEILGTPSYIAPEMFSGKRGAATPAADVYGLGAILYEALAGRPPFPGESHIDVLDRLRRDEPLRLRTLNPRVPRDLETICLRCLEKDPRRRYATAGGMAEDLARFLGGFPIAARPVSAAARGWRWCRRNPGRAGIGTTAFLALILVSVVSAASAARLRKERDATRERFWEASIEGARSARHAGRVGQRFESIARLAEAARIRANSALRSEAVGCLALADLRIERTLDGGLHGRDHYPVPDARFERYAFRATPERIAVRRIDLERIGRERTDPEGIDTEGFDTEGFDTEGIDTEGIDLEHAEGTEGVAADLTIEETGSLFRFSPDGRHLAVVGLEAGRKRLRVWSLERPPRPVALDPDLAGAEAFQFEPGGGAVLAGRADGSLVRHDLSSGATTRVLGREDGLAFPGGVRVHPSGDLVATFDARSPSVQIWNGRDLMANADMGAGAGASSGKKLLRELGIPGIRCLEWHPRRPVLAAGTTGPISIWDAETGAKLAETSSHSSDVISVAFHPTADLLASTSFDNTLRLWRAGSGSEVVRAGGLAFVLFAGDGRLASLSSDLDLRIWDCAPGAERREVTYLGGGNNRIWSLGFSRGDRYLAAVGEGGICIWELPEARSVAAIAAGPTDFAAFEPAGETLLTWGAMGLRAWRAADGQAEEEHAWSSLGRALGLRGNPARAGAASGDGKRLALIVGSWPGKVAVLDAGGDPPPRWLEGPGGLSFLAMAPDGGLVAGGTFHGTGVRVWDAATGAVVRDLPSGGSASVAFTPDGRVLAAVSVKETTLWDATSWEKRLSIPGHLENDCHGFASFSPDGELVAVSDITSPPRILDARSGGLVTELLLRDSWMTRAISFSATGRYVVVGTADDRVHIWDLLEIRAGLREMGLGR